VTRDYLVTNEFVHPDRIAHIFGGVLPISERPPESKGHYGKDKGTLDICFVAAKYTPNGADKGFDVFLDIVSRMRESAPDAVFHVVGGFGPEDVADKGLLEAIRFHGFGRRIR